MTVAGFETKTIEHLGLVAGMFDELGIGELIDEVVPQDQEQRLVSVGRAVKAMTLNGLGFANRRLYLTTRFFKNKPVERLIGAGVTAEMLNDDALGRALDSLHAFGVTELFSLVSKRACERLGVTPKVGHLDSTSFHVDGRYDADEGEEGEGVIRLVPGYSRDHRPDLNQAALELISESEASLPLLMAPLSGNADDKSSFAVAVSEHVAQLQAVGVELVVMDSAGFTPATITALQDAGVTWVVSVPGTLSASKELLVDGGLPFEPLSDGYEAARVTKEHAGVTQRWLVVRSRAAGRRSEAAAKRQLLKLADEERKRFDALCRGEFACEADALKALKRYRQSAKLLEVHDVTIAQVKHYAKRGRPGKNSVPERVTFRLQGALATPAGVFAERVEQGSRFILATNDVTSDQLSDSEVLASYKEQSKVERGFRFLKDPMFLASTMYLKSPARIMALLMVMTVCLLVYAALEHRIRHALAEHAASVPDQKGKLTSKPTAKWVFELFLDVHLLYVTQSALQVMTMNLDEDLRNLLELLGPAYAEAYS